MKANDLANIMNIHVTKSQPEPVVKIDNTHPNLPAESVHVYLPRQNLLRVYTCILFFWKKENSETILEVREKVASIYSQEFPPTNLSNLFPNIHFNGESGDMTNSTYTVLNVCFPISNDKAAMLDFQLDLKGIACSKGSACQSGSSEGSHVLSEIQDDSHKIFPSVRFSFSHNNKKEEVDYLIETLKEFISS